MRLLSQLIAFFCLIRLSVYAQGTVLFDNQYLSSGSAPVFAPENIPLSGNAWCTQLYSAPGLDQEPCALRPAGTRVQFRVGLGVGFDAFISTTTNIFTGQPVNPEVVVTPIINGAATVQMRAWDAAFASFEEAV